MADYIERVVAFNAILKLVPKVDGDGYCWVIRGDAAHAIDSIPSADVAEVRHGKWVNGECSECGGDAPFWPMATTYYRSNFCPNCGADMRKDGE